MRAHQQAEPAQRQHLHRTPDRAEHTTGPARVLALQRTVGNAAVANTLAHRSGAARSLDTLQIQRITDHQEGGVDYQLSETGLFVIVDGGRQIWAKAGIPVSGALARNPAGDRTINGDVYQEYQVSRWILKDCLHTAEEIINSLPGQLHSARELEWEDAPASEGTYSKIYSNKGRYRKFGGDEAANIKNAKEFGGSKDVDAAPGMGEAFIILGTKSQEAPISPYHAAAVVGVDGRDRVTLEEWDDRGKVSRGKASMYTVGDADASFHGAWGGAGAYFGAVAPVTVVIAGTAPAPNRTRDAASFGANTFGDEGERTLDWPATPPSSP